MGFYSGCILSQPVLCYGMRSRCCRWMMCSVISAVFCLAWFPFEATLFSISAKSCWMVSSNPSLWLNYLVVLQIAPCPQGTARLWDRSSADSPQRSVLSFSAKLLLIWRAGKEDYIPIWNDAGIVALRHWVKAAGLAPIVGWYSRGVWGPSHTSSPVFGYVGGYNHWNSCPSTLNCWALPWSTGGFHSFSWCFSITWVHPRSSITDYNSRLF